MTPSDVVALAKEKEVKIVDFKFMDLPGMWQHFSIPATELKEDMFEEGLGFDGSSIRGFQAINESDMLLFPDPATAIVDPVCGIPTLSIICNIKDPITLESYTRDVRHIAQESGRLPEVRRGLPIRVTGDPKPNSSCSMMSVMAKTSIRATILSIRGREVGTPAPTRDQTSAINPATRKGISPCRHRIQCRTFDPR